MARQAIIYTRISKHSDETQASHLSQEQDCRRWAESEGLTVKAVYSETLSGASPLDKRVGLQEAIESLEAGDVFISWRRDRLGREVIVNAVIEKLIKDKKANLYTLDVGSSESIEQKLLATIMDAFAEYERAVNMLRVNSKIASKRERGLCVGNTSLGETKVKREGLTYVERDEAETAKIEQVRAWRAEGLTLSQLVDRCAAEGITTREGSSPAISTVRTWTLGVEIPQEQVEQMEAEARRKSGRPKGTPGKRAEEQNRALRAVLLAYIEQGLSQAEMTRRLEAEGILNSRGKPYARQQVSRILGRLKTSGA